MDSIHYQNTFHHNGHNDTVVDIKSLLDHFKSDPGLYCEFNFRYIIPYPPTEAGQTYCNSTWNTVSCWPTTIAGTVATISCPDKLEGFKFDSSRNATRVCYTNGTWAARANYSQCEILPGETVGASALEDQKDFYRLLIYYIGYGSSTLALVVALVIFLYFRSLRCLRNTIHCHLIATFILRGLIWYLMTIVVPRAAGGPETEWVCKTIVTLFNYVQVTNFFWMFIEGLYLHIMIVWAYQADKLKVWTYILIGWGIPGLLILCWSIVKLELQNATCWLPDKSGTNYYDYIYIAPILLVLLLNLIFLGTIIWVLITKLRASNTLELKQYRKAVKATVILLPLLGLTYVLFIVEPAGDPVTTTVFKYFNAILQSTQGLFVAIFYCFLNNEVRSAISRKFSRWQDHRSINQSRGLQTRASVVSANGQTVGLSNVQSKKRYSTISAFEEKDTNANKKHTVEIKPTEINTDIDVERPLMDDEATV